MTVAEALRRGAARLAAAGVDSPALDARLLLAHAMGLDQAGLLLRRDAPAPDGFGELLDRRAAREPVALILGRQGFWSLELDVSGDTLVPRADTETLIEAALAARAPGTVGRVLDLGTGTGCLLLAALAAYPGAWGLGVDRVPGAAALARRNAAACGLDAAVVCADWAAPIGGTFDLVLSNPPYIPAAEVAGLMPEVARWEPRTALDGGADGLDAYRALLRALGGVLAPGGLAVLELGAGQDGPVGAMARAAGFGTAFRRDLGGVQRALLLEKGVGSAAGLV